MSEEQALDIIQNALCDEVLGTYCVEVKKDFDCTKNCENDDCIYIRAIETLLDLYKQEKEKNKKLTDNYDILTQHFINNHISKDKIRAKIEEWDESIKWANADDRYYAIKILKELLEEE